MLFLFLLHRHGNKRHLSRRFNSIWNVSLRWNFFANFLEYWPIWRNALDVSSFPIRMLGHGLCVCVCENVLGQREFNRTNVMNSRNNNAKYQNDGEIGEKKTFFPLSYMRTRYWLISAHLEEKSPSNHMLSMQWIKRTDPYNSNERMKINVYGCVRPPLPCLNKYRVCWLYECTAFTKEWLTNKEKQKPFVSWRRKRANCSGIVLPCGFFIRFSSFFGKAMKRLFLEWNHVASAKWKHSSNEQTQ